MADLLCVVRYCQLDTLTDIATLQTLAGQLAVGGTGGSVSVAYETAGARRRHVRKCRRLGGSVFVGKGLLGNCYLRKCLKRSACYVHLTSLFADRVRCACNGRGEE